MEKIASFTIDHNRLLRGIYVSRKDQVGGETVTTFDIRMKEPNREPVLHPGALHTIEHLAATYLRNDEQWKDRIIYWGPMGCLTGNYLLMRGDLRSEDIVDLMRRTFMSHFSVFLCSVNTASSLSQEKRKGNQLASPRET